MSSRIIAKKQGKIDLKDLSNSHHIIIDLNSIKEELGNVTEWKESIKPSFILNIERMLREIYDIKEECKSYNCFYYPPEIKVNDKFTKSAIVIQPAVEMTSIRCIIVLGTDEMLEMEATGAGKSGEGEKYIRTGTVMSLPIGFASACRLKFSNTTTIQIPARKGFRETRKTKSPTKRHVFVFDFITNKEAIESKFIDIKESNKSDISKAMSLLD